MREITDLAGFIATAQRQAEPIVAGLLAGANGPTMALLALYVARAELLRVAQTRIPSAHWQRFLTEQAKLERCFDQHCEVLRAMNLDLLKLAGSGGGPSNGAR